MNESWREMDYIQGECDGEPHFLIAGPPLLFIGYGGRCREPQHVVRRVLSSVHVSCDSTRDL